MSLSKIIALFICVLLSETLPAQNYRMQDIDPLDTLDEVDLHAQRDTMTLPRRNLAKRPEVINALDYVLDDRYHPEHHTYENHWYDHIYLGGGYGVERIMPQTSDFTFRTMSQVSLFVGKELDKKNSLRFNIGGGWGYQRETNHYLARVQARMDYLFNLSTHFVGYNPARRMEVSLLAGAGLNHSWMKDSDRLWSPEGRVGVQLKFFTGPLGTINIEPYVGIASDKIDVSGTRNWRGYDVFYGVGFNYSCFIADNLSEEARLQMLQSRLAGDRMVDPQTLERWRTPWFVEASVGAAMSSTDEMGLFETLGNQKTLSIGRWLSPVIGFRLSATSRSTKWLEVETAPSSLPSATQQQSSLPPRAFNSNYFGGRLEALLNPLGFLETFRWDNPWGAYLALGGGAGSLTKYSPEEEMSELSETYGVGVHLWKRLSEDLQAFIEPRYSHNVYTTPAGENGIRERHGDNNFGIDLGVTLLIRSKKFRDLYEMDETQHYTYRDVRGLQGGLGGGMTLLQRRGGYSTGSGVNWNGMAFLEYRFNHLHAARLHGDFLTLNGTDRQRLVFTALNYSVNLTNLCSGRFHSRAFELDGFIGPAVGLPLDGGSTMYGFDLGLKLSANVWKGLSAFLTPTVYFVGKEGSLPGISTMRLGSLQSMQTLTLGVQYKLGKSRHDYESARRKRMEKDQRWERRQKKVEAERKQKSEERRQRREADRTSGK